MVEMATTNIRIIADANMEINPAYVQMESNPACNKIMNMENNLAVVKIQGDPVYYTMQRIDANLESNPPYVQMEYKQHVITL